MLLLQVMLFGALFSSYILLRVGAPEGFWPLLDQLACSISHRSFLAGRAKPVAFRCWI